MQKYGIPVSVYDKIGRSSLLCGRMSSAACIYGRRASQPSIFLQLLENALRAMGAKFSRIRPSRGLNQRGKNQGCKTRVGGLKRSKSSLPRVRGLPSSRVICVEHSRQPARGYNLTTSAIKHMPRQALILGDRRVAVSRWKSSAGHGSSRSR